MSSWPIDPKPRQEYRLVRVDPGQSVHPIVDDRLRGEANARKIADQQTASTGKSHIVIDKLTDAKVYETIPKDKDGNDGRGTPRP